MERSGLDRFDRGGYLLQSLLVRFRGGCQEGLGPIKSLVVGCYRCRTFYSMGTVRPFSRKFTSISIIWVMIPFSLSCLQSTLPFISILFDFFLSRVSQESSIFSSRAHLYGLLVKYGLMAILLIFGDHLPFQNGCCGVGSLRN